jgi:hypothetical protein
MTNTVHGNGFTQLFGQFGGLEQDFDLGYKFEERESDEFQIDPHTGNKVFPEPFLALYFSASPKGSTQVPTTLCYARTRSHFSRGLHPTVEDQGLLLKAATPSIIADLQLLLKGEEPESARRFIYR